MRWWLVPRVKQPTKAALPCDLPAPRVRCRLSGHFIFVRSSLDPCRGSSGGSGPARSGPVGRVCGDGRAVRVADDEATPAPWSLGGLADDLMAARHGPRVNRVDVGHLETDERRVGGCHRWRIGHVDDLEPRWSAGREHGAVTLFGP